MNTLKICRDCKTLIQKKVKKKNFKCSWCGSTSWPILLKHETSLMDKYGLKEESEKEIKRNKRVLFGKEI